MADRAFHLRQTRPGFGHAGADEVLSLGTGMAHDDGTADVVPVIGSPGRIDLADIEKMTEATPGGFRTEIIWDE